MASKPDTGDLDKIGKDFLTCGLCLGYYQNAKTLPCLHSFCENCLIKLVEKRGMLVCPYCRTAADIQGSDGVGLLRNNSLINGLVEFVKSRDLCTGMTDVVICDGCEENTASNRCITCATNLCSPCTKTLTKIAACKRHNVMSLNELKNTTPEKLSSFRPSTRCNVDGHGENTVKFYCDNCDVPTCLECTVVNHNGHKHRYVKDVAAEFTPKMSEVLEKLAKKEDEIKLAVESGNQRLIEIQDLYEKETAKVKKRAEEIIKKIKTDEEKALGILTKNRDTLQKHLECEIDRLEITEKSVTSARKFIKTLVNYGDAGEIVSECKRSMNRAEGLIDTDNINLGCISIFRFFPKSTVLEMKNSIGLIGPDASKTTRTNIPKILYDGESFQVDVQTVDVNGERVVADTDDITVKAKIEKPDNTTCDLMTTNDGDGNYKVMFPGQQVAKYNLIISIGDEKIPGSPFIIDVMSEEEMAQKIKVGSIVARGKDWNRENIDGNPPREGRVTEIYKITQCLVQWSSGNQWWHYNGYNGQFQIKLSEFY
ncbi:tripartite motif-containing protein 2-like [Saccoglossus kowalevskii]|uniref:Tripartite motif-containing protein 2-like n=1 Tax=Saccoglossus kowalevskii TaxID=10224 RepID=A0ABM0LTR1_SACKO|nr:PREDICTED: tripartite motif-containing protein 2-like [Saccoglossus kowalevskii]